MSRKLVVLLVVFALASVSFGATLISSWENASGDGDKDWGSGESIADPVNENDTAAYTFGATVGNTSGIYSLQVDQDGWGQSLTIVLDYEQRVALLTNSVFAIDFTVAASDNEYTAGYSQIYEVVMNSNNGGGWTAHTESTIAVNYYWWAGTIGERTSTAWFAYDPGVYTAVPDYCEIVFALNTGGGAPTTMYFDGARLVPEPMTIALLGLGGLFLRRRK